MLIQYTFQHSDLLLDGGGWCDTVIKYCNTGALFYLSVTDDGHRSTGAPLHLMDVTLKYF